MNDMNAKQAPKLAIAMNYINDDLISGAIDYKPAPRKKVTHFWKHIVAVAACMIVVLGINDVHSHLKEYVTVNDIQVHYAATDDDRVSAADVTPAQAEKIAEANNMHNLITIQNLEWYGSCYYDFETDMIKVGLTENTEANQKQILEVIDDVSIQFYECEYSYQYLENVYNSLESRQFILKAVGVERYNISIENNRVNVYITNTERYAAIYMVNELANADGAVVFKTTSYSADAHS